MVEAGLLRISGRWQGGVVRDLAVRLQRPAAARLLVGLPASQVALRVPRLYSLCGQAQGLACRLALQAAGAELPACDPASDALADLWTEMLHEHLWRLLLDWPPLLGQPAAKAAFLEWRRQRGQAALVAATAQIWRDWLAAPWGEACRAGLPDLSNFEKFDLPALTPEAWLAYWRGLADRPPAEGVPGGIGEAYQQRLAAAEAAAQGLARGGDYPAAACAWQGFGVSQVLTARGVLTHAVQLAAGQVVDYAVWAPTDRLFADAAPLAALLDGRSWPSREAAEIGLTQAVLALDPCLAYRIELEG